MEYELSYMVRNKKTNQYLYRGGFYVSEVQAGKFTSLGNVKRVISRLISRNTFTYVNNVQVTNSPDSIIADLEIIEYFYLKARTYTAHAPVGKPIKIRADASTPSIKPNTPVTV